MTRLQKIRKLFIERMIEASTPSDELLVYKSLYPNCKSKKSLMTACGRLLKNVEIADAIAEGRRKREELIRQIKREELIRMAKEQVAHESEIDAVMSSIALGRFRRKRKVVLQNKKTGEPQIVTLEEEPTETDMIAAGDKLYRRKGSYAPTAVKHEGGDTFLEFMKGLATLNNKNIPQ